jgi:hypothetical protein
MAAGTASTKGTLLKLLLIGAGLVVLVGGVAVGGLVYVGFRVKDRVEQAARDFSPDRGSPSRPAPAAVVAARRIDACTLLTREEAAEILGVAIERAESKPGTNDSTCEYFARPRSKAERGAAVAGLFRDMSQRGARPEPGEITPANALRQSGMEGLLKEVSGLARPDGPYLAVTVNWEGGRTAVSMLKLVSGVAAPGLKTAEDLEGIGDQAVLGAADSVLAFVKGQTGVQIGLALVPQGRERGIAIARKIASRL